MKKKSLIKENHQYYQAIRKAIIFLLSLPMPIGWSFIRIWDTLVVVVTVVIQAIHGQITLGNVQAFSANIPIWGFQPIAQIANLSNTYPTNNCFWQILVFAGF